MKNSATEKRRDLILFALETGLSITKDGRVRKIERAAERRYPLTSALKREKRRDGVREKRDADIRERLSKYFRTTSNQNYTNG